MPPYGPGMIPPYIPPPHMAPYAHPWVAPPPIPGVVYPPGPWGPIHGEEEGETEGWFVGGWGLDESAEAESEVDVEPLEGSPTAGDASGATSESAAALNPPQAHLGKRPRAEDVFGSSSGGPAAEGADAEGGMAVKLGSRKELQQQSPSLRLNYEDVISAWSDQAPEGQSPWIEQEEEEGASAEKRDGLNRPLLAHLPGLATASPSLPGSAQDTTMPSPGLLGRRARRETQRMGLAAVLGAAATSAVATTAAAAAAVAAAAAAAAAAVAAAAAAAAASLSDRGMEEWEDLHGPVGFEFRVDASRSSGASSSSSGGGSGGNGLGGALLAGDGGLQGEEVLELMRMGEGGGMDDVWTDDEARSWPDAGRADWSDAEKWSDAEDWSAAEEWRVRDAWGDDEKWGDDKGLNGREEWGDTENWRAGADRERERAVEAKSQGQIRSHEPDLSGLAFAEQQQAGLPYAVGLASVQQPLDLLWADELSGGQWDGGGEMMGESTGLMGLESVLQFQMDHNLPHNKMPSRMLLQKHGQYLW
ncbi:unnamed protein product [Closterium sp. Naga37s-1]|nr:unnamed protein product [Closterium sp. Naga37s-1]